MGDEQLQDGGWSPAFMHLRPAQAGDQPPRYDILVGTGGASPRAADAWLAPDYLLVCALKLVSLARGAARGMKSQLARLCAVVGALLAAPAARRAATPVACIGAILHDLTG